MRLSPGLLLTCVGPRERRIVWAAEAVPQLCRAQPVAGKLGRPWIGSGEQGCVVDPGAAAPAGKLTDQPTRPLAQRELEGYARRRCDRGPITLQPSCFGAGAGDRGDALQLPGRFGKGQRRVEQRPDAWLTSARAHERAHAEWKDP